MGKKQGKQQKKKGAPDLGHLRAPYGKKQVTHLRDNINFHQRFLDAQAAVNHRIEQDRLRALGHHRGLL